MNPILLLVSDELLYRTDSESKLGVLCRDLQKTLLLAMSPSTEPLSDRLGVVEVLTAEYC